MNRDEVLETLRKHKQVLRERFDVTGLALYGSFARNQATPESDVDVLVEFAGRATSKTYFGALAYLEDLFGRPVDMSTIGDVRSAIRPYVERDAINV
jgi:predicted nucleotidyltransferase